ncbi:hydroxyethylthiazole kinase [Siminovitchia acidinfaciens]|uniref:Hydroxyethylthiazole kinase n=1 Tax=Siminovitchia acidinfaciens TaxID=2321395 RepID=A0A429XWY4_9BACI|nr:hydroxyethylthiazole kinase [Siminovitchia acidinfaciens]RST73003.1 hydroxyethylthiazole kinase [Siminovitchia acidinfaciens]
MKRNISKLFNIIREERPLIHQITNQVTMNDCANVTLAVGAIPVMASSPEEAAEMAMLAKALVINIGTLRSETFEGMIAAAKAANKSGIPVIVDPVGAGATCYRTSSAMEILKVIRPAVIRGNASEVNQLIGGASTTIGVDAGRVPISNAEIAKKAAETYECITVVSGKEDAVSDGNRTYLIRNGHSMLSKITGTGCMSSALIACFAAVEKNILSSAAAGISLMGIAGEMAAASLSKSEGLGTFKVRLMDFISLMNDEMWDKGAKISEV